MSLLDNASLLLTPNAYKEGKLYSIIPSNGNGDFTATRATTATRVNSAGLVDLVPYNLLQYSEMFSNAAWSKFAVSLTANTTTAPDGTLTADSLIEDSANSAHFTSLTTTSAFGTYTASIYAKPNGRNWIFLNLYLAPNSGAWFDVQNGVVGTILSNITSATITAVGNGWYRCTITGANATVNPRVAAYISSADNVTSYLGNGTSGLFIWGAQLVEGTSARDYLRTETRLNIPRLDYSLGGCPNILLEPQRTNLALQSSSFDNASWTKSTTTATANTTTSPSGITDADTLTADGGAASTRTLQSANISVTSGTSYTFTIYAKKNTNNFIQLFATSTLGGMFANFDLNNGVVGSVGTISGTNPTSSIQAVGNGWYRCSMTLTSVSSGVASIGVYIVTSATSARNEQNTLSTSVFLWGAQLEAGAYATSYIPTTTASVTRNADSITRNNIFTNGLITASGGTWFVELRNNVARTRDGNLSGVPYLGDSNSAASGNNFRILGFTASRYLIQKFVAGVATTIYTTTSNTSKIAIKWNGSTADVFENGVKVVSATSFTATNLDFLAFRTEQVMFNLNEMALFPTPLTDAQCLALTA